MQISKKSPNKLKMVNTLIYIFSFPFLFLWNLQLLFTNLKWVEKELKESNSTLKYQQKARFAQYLHISLIIAIGLFEGIILCTHHL